MGGGHPVAGVGSSGTNANDDFTDDDEQFIIHEE
jgi:hypothetical protein